MHVQYGIERINLTQSRFRLVFPWFMCLTPQSHDQSNCNARLIILHPLLLLNLVFLPPLLSYFFSYLSSFISSYISPYISPAHTTLLKTSITLSLSSNLLLWENIAAMIDITEPFKSRSSPAVPAVPVPTNDAVYQVAGDTGKRTLWSARPKLCRSCLSKC